MSQTSPVMGLPYLQPAQAQKHVTHNEALRILDAVTQLSVATAPQSDPPTDPQEGARYIVDGGGTSAWAGQDQAIAVYVDSAWQFFAPAPGWRADVADTGATLRFDGTAWQSIGDLDSLSELGINTSADSTNRLAVAAPATLLTHDGAGHQIKVNKNTDSDTASLLFQTGWSGRAEMGTTGSDDFAVKVSPDGATFYTGLALQAASGAVHMPQGQCFFDEVTITDDSSWNRDIPWSDPARILLWIGIDAPGHAYLVSITGALAGATNFATLSAQPAGTLNLLSGGLGGTTGPDGALNLSIETGGSTPQLHIENRLGAAHLVTLATLGR